MQVRSAAYHEAAHITAAAVQDMPLRAAGLYVDLMGHGSANYFDRPTKDLGMTPVDEVERKRTIIALLAAHQAELRFFPQCNQFGWRKDLEKVRALSSELHPTDEAARIATVEDLRVRAQTVVDTYWPVIEALALAILAKPCTPMPVEEFEEGWGFGEVRNLTGQEVVEILAQHGIRAKIMDDSTKNYDSNQDKPHFDTLA